MQSGRAASGLACTGSVVAFVVSLTLRLGAGEHLIGLPAFIDYPRLLAGVLPGSPADWVDSRGNVLVPFRTLAMLAGLVLLPLASRLTGRLDPPRHLCNRASEPAVDAP